MQKQRTILIAGIVLALLAVFMVKVYLDQQRQTIMGEASERLSELEKDRTTVLVARKDIPRGAKIERASVEEKNIPNAYVQPKAASSLERIEGMITVAPIAKGEQITLSKLSFTRQAGGLAESTPAGKRAVTISVDNIASLAGLIKPGDYVDVIAMMPIPVQGQDGKPTTQGAVMPLFQNVLVLAVGQQVGRMRVDSASPRGDEDEEAEERKQESSPLITLALNPQEVNLIAFVSEQAKIRLVLRSPADSRIEPVQPASWDTLFQYVFPGMFRGPSDEELDKPIVEEVEIYRGLSREKMPISK